MRYIVVEGGDLIPRDEYFAGKATAHGPMVVNDIAPFISPIDRKVIGSRKHLRDHERAHGVRQVGNDLNSFYRDRLGIDLPR